MDVSKLIERLRRGAGPSDIDAAAAALDDLTRKLAEAVEVVRDLLDDLDSTGRLQSDGPLERARALILPTDDWEARMYQKQESGK